MAGLEVWWGDNWISYVRMDLGYGVPEAAICGIAVLSLLLFMFGIHVH